jgi:hypothetical protein
VSYRPCATEEAVFRDTGDVDHVTLISTQHIIVCSVLTNDKTYMTTPATGEDDDSPIARFYRLTKLEPVPSPIRVLTYGPSEGFIGQGVLDSCLSVVTTPRHLLCVAQTLTITLEPCSQFSFISALMQTKDFLALNDPRQFFRFPFGE